MDLCGLIQINVIDFADIEINLLIWQVFVMDILNACAGSR